MSRFISWLAVGIAAAFLVVVSASFSPGTAASLALAVGISTLSLSAYVVYSARGDVPAVVLGIASVAISAWTIVASMVFSASTAQSLALASSLAISGIAVAGLTAHEFENDYVVQPRRRDETSPERESSLAAAA